MNSPQTPSRPSCRQYPQRLTRDQRVQVRTLANEGYSRRKISQNLAISYRQVCYTLKNADLSPKNSTGRPPVLSKSQVDEIESFVCSSPENRQMSYLQLTNFVFRHFGVS
ncbi:hypothetical protein K3495_g15946 [Podosphaera aphanis]|nr:hypothetical protein K3495_g15946 [Podosphaera aphanis]